MGKKNYYAVRQGKGKGIYRTWEECKEKVFGCPGAEYKGFKTKEEAEEYMAGAEEKQVQLPRDCVKIYVDGSYSDGEFAYGMVVLRNGYEYLFSQKVEDAFLVNMNNVAGEIKGAQAAMDYALQNNLKNIAIYYDYVGIEKWCTGEWQARQPGTQEYRDMYKKVKEKVNIYFVKVKGHSHDRYNDMADELARKALGIE